ATTRFDNAIYDLSLRLKHTRARPDIVIVAMDPASLQTEGEWPWPRRTLAHLVDNIAKDRPAALAFHFLFFTPSADDPVLRDAIARARTYLGVLHRDPKALRGAHALQPVAKIAAAA